jgi:hypothetical protein
MRRIFTSTIFVAALFAASFNSFAQTTTCSTPSTSGTAANYNQVDASTLTINSGATSTYNSPISYFSTATATIPFYLKLRKIENGGNADFTAQVTIKWGAGGVNSFTCTTSGTIAGPSGNSTADPSTNYYFSITPSTQLPAGVNFQISVVIHNVGNKNMQVTGYAIANGAVTPAGAALPVKFQSLDARPVSSSVSLRWNVASEENMSGYNVERSTDGRNFSQIAFVSASGQSDYSFVDSKPTATAYYRIKSVDINGKYGYSTVALVKSGKSSIVLNAFPSPVIKSVSIQHPTATAGTSISVSSADGRIMKTIIPAAGMQQTEIDLSGAKAGLYLVRYNSGNGESETLKILKQ